MPSKIEKYNIYIFSEKKSEIEILNKILSKTKIFSLYFFNNLSDFIDFTLKKKLPDMIMLSNSLSEISYRDLLLILRKNKKTSAAIIVIFSDELSTSKKDFDSGIDEFFDLKRDSADFIKVRILNLLERKKVSINEQKLLKFKDLEVFLDSHLVKLKKTEIKLTNLEFEILIYFLENKGRVITRNNLIEAVWKEPFSASLRSVDKRIEILRKKLGKYGKYIKTVFSVGYIFDEHF